MTAQLGKFAVAQIGAREHYAIPRALLELECFDGLYTDFWAGPLLRRSASSLLPALTGRYDSAIDSRQITSFPLQTFHEKLFDLSRGPAKNRYVRWLEVGATFGKNVTRSLQRRRPAHDVLFAYNTGALEPLFHQRSVGKLGIVGQIDPARTEQQIVEVENRKWPGWALQDENIPDAYFQRMDCEWEAADLVVVNSEWSKLALIAQGVPESKLDVWPLAFELSTSLVSPSPVTDNSKKKFTVLWLGQVILRKGIQYLMEAARKLSSSNIEFLIVGPIGITPAAVQTAPSNVKFLGAVPRSRVGEIYGQADLFVLPTLSDGFAITQLEAMAHGLPVIATDRCGKVVTPGQDGLIVEAADSDDLASAIDRLCSDNVVRIAMAQAARATARRFSLSNLAEHIRRSVVGLSDRTLQREACSQ